MLSKTVISQAAYFLQVVKYQVMTDLHNFSWSHAIS